MLARFPSVSRVLPGLALLLNAGLLGLAPRSASAQSAQKYAFQLAALSTTIVVGGSSVTTNGFGIEPQLRFNRLYATEQFAVSLGLGAQYTAHSAGPDELSLSGVFLEPRFVPVIGSTRIFPYLSGRVALMRQSSNFGSASNGSAFGAGAGLVVRLSSRVNLDGGAQLLRQQFGDFTFRDDGSVGGFNPFTSYAAKVGLNVGFPR